MQQTREPDTPPQNNLSSRWAQGETGLWFPRRSLDQAPASKRKGQSTVWIQRQVAGKTLWDWMSLLLIPLLIGIGTILVTNRQTDAQNALSAQLHQSDQAQHQQDEKIAQQARWDDLLKQYRDGIDALLLSNGLRQAHPGDDVSEIAHARTLDVLEAVNASHRGLVIAYLSNLKLIQGSFMDARGVRHQRQVIVSLSKADLFGANLSGVVLSGADLSSANLSRADLSGANLSGADLPEAYLFEADLSSANLSSADLSGADLSRTDLSGADLSEAYLFGADLSEAYLSGADLSEAYLSGADLSGADLLGANLSGANLSGANLSEVHFTLNQLHSVFSLSGATSPNGSVCQKVSNTDQFNIMKQAKNRDECLQAK